MASFVGKAVVLTASGGPEVLKAIADHSVRAPAAGEVLVKLVATSVNPVDVYVRSGTYASPVFPKVIGGDVAGHVAAVGAGSKFSVGDAVYALSNSYVPYNEYEGTYAEYALLKEEWVAAAPAALPLTHAAAVPLVGLTALQALEKAAPQPGQRVLILGASGGVGQIAIQIAKVVFSLHVTAASSARNAELVRRLGADEVWDYSANAEGLKVAFATNKFDIVIDTVGGELLAAAFDVLAPGGCVSHIMNRGSGGADVGHKEAFENGTGPRFATTLVAPSGEQLAQIAKLFDEKKLSMLVAREFPLEEAGAAQELVITGHAGGKVILTI